MPFPQFIDGDKNTHDKLNDLVTELKSILEGGITNVMINGSAAINGSKLADDSVSNTKFSAYTIDSSQLTPTSDKVVIAAEHILNQSFQDIGISFSVNESVASRVFVVGSFIFGRIKTEAGPCKVRMLIDDVVVGEQAQFRASSDDTAMRVTVVGTWMENINSGSRTIKFQAEKTNPGTGNERLRAETRIIYWVFAQ